MNTNSINHAIEKGTGLRKSEKKVDYTRDSGNGNIAYRLNKVDRWRNGDFHVVKYYQNTFDFYFDNVDAREHKDDVIKVLTDMGCTNIIDHADRGFIKFDIPKENIMNSYKIKSSIDADKLADLSHEIAKSVISGRMSMDEAVGKVMKEMNCNERYAKSCIDSWIEKEPTYNGMVMNSSRQIKSSEKPWKGKKWDIYRPGVDEPYVTEDFDEMMRFKQDGFKVKLHQEESVKSSHRPVKSGMQHKDISNVSPDSWRDGSELPKKNFSNMSVEVFNQDGDEVFYDFEAKQWYYYPTHKKALVKKWVEKNFVYSSRRPIKSDFEEDYDLEDGYDTSESFHIESPVLQKVLRDKGYRLRDFWQDNEDYVFSAEQDGIEAGFTLDSVTRKLYGEKPGDFSQMHEIDTCSNETEVADGVEWFWDNYIVSENGKEINNSRRPVKSARYIATDPESGEVLGSADTYEEAVNEWGEDVTITDSKSTERESVNLMSGTARNKQSLSKIFC